MPWIRLAILAMSLLSLPGCALLKLDNELSELSNTVALIGEIHADDTVPGKTVLMALQKKHGVFEIVDYQILARPGPFAVVLPHGSYVLVAFADTNANKVYETGEAVGWTEEAITPSGAVQENIVISLSSRLVLPGKFPKDAGASNVAPKKFKSDLGAIANLDNPIFSPAYGKLGLWEPMTFINEVRGGVFLLEKYDPAKTPVLFVHGAGGSPQDWRYFFEKLDRSRYQPWFYYYASGLPLEDSAYWLNRSIEALHAKLGFKHMVVTAHSMGSLVARRFISLNSKNNPNSYIKLFVSLSAPWGGVSSAANGVKHLPTPIPSWVDLAPKSKFLESIYANPLPANLSYVLFFSYRGGSLWIDENSDGTISLSSQLDPHMQTEAIRIVGIDEDHTNILNDSQTLLIYREILEKVEL